MISSVGIVLSVCSKTRSGSISRSFIPWSKFMDSKRSCQRHLELRLPGISHYYRNYCKEITPISQHFWQKYSKRKKQILSISRVPFSASHWKRRDVLQVPSLHSGGCVSFFLKQLFASWILFICSWVPGLVRSDTPSNPPLISAVTKTWSNPNLPWKHAGLIRIFINCFALFPRVFQDASIVGAREFWEMEMRISM